MRISGFATGMDIEQIVNDLMRAERIPVNKLEQSRQIIQWKMELYREINRKLDTFRNNIFDTVMRQANMLARRATSSNENVATVVASSNAGNTTIRLKVNSLATAASYNSTEKVVKDGEKIDTSRSLWSQADHFAQAIEWETGIVHTKNIQLTSNTAVVDLHSHDIDAEQLKDIVVKVNGKTYKVVTSPDELGEGTVYFNQSNGTLEFSGELRQGTTLRLTYVTDQAAEETFTVSEDEQPKKTFQLSRGAIDVDSLQVSIADGEPLEVVTNRDELEEGKVYVNVETGQLEFASALKDVEMKVTYKQNYVKADITAYDESGEVYDNFIFMANQSLNQVFTELNRSAVNVNGFYDDFQGVVNVSRSITGKYNDEGEEITFGGFFKDVLKLDGEAAVQAQNASVEINGLKTERYSNTFTVSGMTVTIKGTTTGEEEITLSSSIDTDKVFETIKQFVDEYNELIDFINGKLTEQRYRDYPPLTDEQKEAMSEKEIERWEERAKSGLLRNDYTLKNPLYKMRLELYNPVDIHMSTEFRQLSAIGITTSRDYMAHGKLEINEDQLRAAIEQDPEGVFQLFAQDGNTGAEKGIARRLRDTLEQAITAIAERAGGFRGKIANHQFTLGRELNSINDRISNFERRLEKIEERYWRQFNAMELAVQRANQQAEMLYAQLFGFNF